MFSSREEAEKYARPDKAFVVWVGRDVGIMSQAQCIKATQRLTNAKMCGPMSQSAATKKWKSVKTKAKVVADKKPKAPTTPTKKVNKTKQRTPKKKKKFFYAVAVGKVPGVYDTWAEAEKQVKGIRLNSYAKFTSRARAQEFVDKQVNKAVSEEEEEVEETEEVEEPEPDQGDGELDIDIPSMAKLQEAEEKGQIRVFACHTDVGKARVAVTWEDAIDGVDNPAVQVINAKSTLLDNLAEAEIRLRKDKTHVRKSLSDRLAAARARAGATSHAKKSTTATTQKTKGESLGAFVGLSAVGRAKETRMISYYFLNSDLKPIKTVYDQVPFMHELDEDMDLPETKAAFNPSADVKDLTIKDFFTAKEKAMPTWKLMDLQEFMSFCRKAQRMCQSSSKKGAAANAVAIGELMDVGLRTYRTMERLNELGTDNIRFKARMYLHLQCMSTYRVFHASAIAMTVFSDATDPFVARLPAQRGYKGRQHSPSPATSASEGRKYTPRKDVSPVSGCYKCAATDHYANDERFHPLREDGSHEKVPEEEKAAIMERIDKSTLSAALKAAEKEKVRRYWAQHKL